MQNEQKILTQETFSYLTAKAGDLVEEAVAYNAMDCMPPAHMSAECIQMGEPYSERWDPEMEKGGQPLPRSSVFPKAYGSIAAIAFWAKLWKEGKGWTIRILRSSIAKTRTWLRLY